MKKVPRISESEWQVMKVLWERYPQTANEVVESLSGYNSWKPKTIKTLLNRLCSKKALSYRKRGREYLYYPLVGEMECVKAESHSFLRRVYSGTMKPMLAAFLESDELSSEDIQNLRQILEEKRRG